MKLFNNSLANKLTIDENDILVINRKTMEATLKIKSPIDAPCAAAIATDQQTIAIANNYDVCVLDLC